MAISSLRIANFRNLGSVELDPAPQGVTLLYGDNGSGKTSLLEAIYFLSLGRSFRTATSARLIQQTTKKFSISSQIVTELRQLSLGVEKATSGETRLRVAEKDAASMAELAAWLPIRLINSQSHHLFESGPSYRRKFLDWGLFYQFDHFLPGWRQFERVLKQRNSVLKQKRSRIEQQAWTEEFVKHAMVLHELRQEYVSLLVPHILALTEVLLDFAAPLTFHYQPGWDTHQGLADVLVKAYPEEIYQGHTLYGPHRADLAITMEGVPVKHFLSRGQQKLLICAMIVAQGILLDKQLNKRVIYLVDDLPAELGWASRQKLMSLLTQQNTQIFVTAIERDAVCEVLNSDTVPIKMFHVKHGTILEDCFT